ncbi:MAG: hypothetical protein NZ703_15595, partial [Gemmataceae bacterium]|nr:hypothetical protein [Gemmataceae bacterium]
MTVALPNLHSLTLSDSTTLRGNIAQQLATQRLIWLKGTLYRRPANQPTASWEKLTDTPTLLDPKPLYHYQLNLSSGVSDAELVWLQELVGVEPLMFLNLEWCSKITDAGLAHLAQLTQLQQLDLESCSKITDAGLAHLAPLTQLQHLNLRGCDNITDAGLAHLAKLTQLQQLNLTGCF